MKLIFLTYLNRSGSTYLANLLGSSEEVLVLPEADILVSSFLENPAGLIHFNEKKHKKLQGILSNDPKLKHWGVQPDSIIQQGESLTGFDVFTRILDTYRNNHKPKASAMVFKAERIIHLVPGLMNAHSKVDVRFLALIRDPRGTFLSQRDTVSPVTGLPFCRNPVYAAIRWREFTKLCERYRNSRGLHVLQFEQLIRSRNKVLDGLIHAFELEPFGPDPGKGDLYERIPEDHRGIHTNVKGDPLLEKTDEWKGKLSGREINYIEKTTGKQMMKWGYVTEQNGTGSFSPGRIISEINFIVTTLMRKFVFHINPVKHAF